MVTRLNEASESREARKEREREQIRKRAIRNAVIAFCESTEEPEATRALTSSTGTRTAQYDTNVQYSSIKCIRDTDSV